MRGIHVMAHLLDRENTLNTAASVLATALPEALAIYAFGSFARGDERPDSDLDLAVLLLPKAQIPDKLGLMADLSRAVGREVDLVSLREASLDLVSDLLREGRQLLVRRPSDVLTWEAERMTDYALFNERRAEIVSMYMNEPLRGHS
jgi:predicted nucleotidyltransferase